MPDQYGILEPKELRIGNILFYEEKGMFVHVTSLSLDIDDEYEPQIGVCEVGKTMGEIVRWERKVAFKPIPLTPDILEKAGFQWTTKGLAYHKSVEAIMLWNRPEAWAVCTKQGHAFAYIKHLHQLQNICHAINGIELEVNL